MQPSCQLKHTISPNSIPSPTYPNSHSHHTKSTPLPAHPYPSHRSTPCAPFCLTHVLVHSCACDKKRQLRWMRCDCQPDSTRWRLSTASRSGGGWGRAGVRGRSRCRFHMLTTRRYGRYAWQATVCASVAVGGVSTRLWPAACCLGHHAPRLHLQLHPA